ncbi:MAG TPA: HEAT repeat domain-containing protein [Planctomycetota bacterium]|jgi:hypothetical protein|nr:HEAT repeat domain-containing protein [Planctomycetota bacterium]
MSMPLRRAALVLLLALGACSSQRREPEKDPNDPGKVDLNLLKRNSRNLQDYIGAMLLAGSTNPGDWAESKKQFDLVSPFFVFQEDPTLIRQFKAGSETARRELGRRGMLLQAVVTLSSGYNREKWEAARKTLMDAGEPGQVLLCTTLLGMLLNVQNIQIFPQIRFALAESGAFALETTTGLGKELAAQTPADAAVFNMDDLVQVLMVVISFGDAGRGALDEFSRSPKSNVRRCVARSIGESKDGSALSVLLRLQADPEWTVRMSATQSMGQMGSVRSVAGPALVERLGKEKDGLVFRATLRAIGDLLYADAVPDLIKVLELPSRETLEAAMGALYIITGEKHLSRDKWYEWYRTRYPDWKKKNAKS